MPLQEEQAAKYQTQKQQKYRKKAIENIDDNFNLFFDDDIMSKILDHTNNRINETIVQKKIIEEQKVIINSHCFWFYYIGSIILVLEPIFALKIQKKESNSGRLRPATLLKKSLWYSCFPVNFVEFLRTPFVTEHIWTTTSAVLYATKPQVGDKPHYIYKGNYRLCQVPRSGH